MESEEWRVGVVELRVKRPVEYLMTAFEKDRASSLPDELNFTTDPHFVAD